MYLIVDFGLTKILNKAKKKNWDINRKSRRYMHDSLMSSTWDVNNTVEPLVHSNTK